MEQESNKKESKGSLAELVKERDQVCSLLHLLVVCLMATRWTFFIENRIKPIIARCWFSVILFFYHFYVVLNSRPIPSNRHHRSTGDCLEGKGENYQVCSVQYCVQQLCTVQCTHIWTDYWVLSHWAHFTVLRFIFRSSPRRWTSRLELRCVRPSVRTSVRPQKVFPISI